MLYPLCRFVLGLDTYRGMQRAIKPSQHALFKVDIAKCSICTLRLLRSTPHPLSTSSAVRLLHVERAAGLDPPVPLWRQLGKSDQPNQFRQNINYGLDSSHTTQGPRSMHWTPDPQRRFFCSSSTLLYTQIP